MTSKGILRALKKYGTSRTVQAMLFARKTDGATEALWKQGRLLSSLLTILEKKKLLRRGHIIEMLCAAVNIESEEHTCHSTQD